MASFSMAFRNRNEVGKRLSSEAEAAALGCADLQVEK